MEEVLLLLENVLINIDELNKCEYFKRQGRLLPLLKIRSLTEKLYSEIERESFQNPSKIVRYEAKDAS